MIIDLKYTFVILFIIMSFSCEDKVDSRVVYKLISENFNSLNDANCDNKNQKYIDANSGRELDYKKCNIGSVDLEIYFFRGRPFRVYILDSNFISIEGLKIGSLIDDSFKVNRVPGVFDYVLIEGGIKAKINEKYRRVDFFIWERNW